MGYTAHLCTSINEEVVHGIPSKDRVVRDGDILSIDFGIVREGYYGDSAMTFPVGALNGVSSRLLAATERSLAAGIGEVGPEPVGGCFAACRRRSESEGSRWCATSVGHGSAGRSREPQIPNFGKRGVGPKLMPGMTPGHRADGERGGWPVEVLADGWTVVTRDREPIGPLRAHGGRHQDGCRILSLPCSWQ